VINKDSEYWRQELLVIGISNNGYINSNRGDEERPGYGWVNGYPTVIHWTLQQ